MAYKKKKAPQKRHWFSNILILAIFLAGVSILCYPVVSDMVNQYQQNQVVSGYQEAVNQQSAEEIAQMKQAAQLYNEDLLKDEIIVDPFDQVQNKKAGIEYYQSLDPQKNGVMGMVRIPAIDVSLPIYHGTEEEVLQKAIGHLEQTSLPIGGAGTHAVISGHRGLPSAKLFTDLNLLKTGDVFYVDVLDETLAYKVDQIKTVEPHELEDLAIISGEDHVTLVTCTPYAINSHRLLVRGTRIPYEEAEEVQKQEEAAAQKDFLPYLAAGVAALVLVILIILFMFCRKKAGRK